MDPAIYPKMAAVEDTHWWFAARRAIVDSLIARLRLPPAAAILEPGCGTGGNFTMLSKWGRVHATDADETALRLAGARGIAEVAPGALPAPVPFGDLAFDLIVMTDVLEHLDDDLGSLTALRARLRRGGALIATVPSTPWLTSAHDVMHHHRRRYTARGLREIVMAAGFTVDYLSYFNFILFPAIAAVRAVERIGRAKRPSAPINGNDRDLDLPPRLVNNCLRAIFSSERFMLGGRLTIPFGVSLILVARA